MRDIPPEERIDLAGQPGVMQNVRLGQLIYENALASADDLRDWRLEGQASLTFPQGRLRLESVLPKDLGQKANYLVWCPRDFPDNVVYSWDFYPIREPGLAMFWCCAAARDGRDLFDPALPPRTGEYVQYHRGKINAYHASYFRRGRPGGFNICNLRKSYGFHLVAQGGDPIPSFVYEPPYRIQLFKRGPELQFVIDDLVVWYFLDDGRRYGPVLGGGKLGFRQMAPLVAEYANLRVHRLEPIPHSNA